MKTTHIRIPIPFQGYDRKFEPGCITVVTDMLTENDKGELIGVISSESLLSYYGSDQQNVKEEVTASDVMDTEPITVNPETLTIDAIRMMRQSESTCVSVIEKGKLVGLFTESDYLKFSEQMFEQISHQTKHKK